MRLTYRKPSAREMRRQMQRAEKLSQTRTRRISREHGDKPLIVGAALVFGPLEAILDQIERDGTLSCSRRGRPMFRDLTDGNWYGTAAALAGVIDHLEMYETRHGVTLPIESLRQFHRFVDHSMVIPEALMTQLRRDLPALQRVIALSDPADVVDLYRQVQIKIELEKVHGTDQTAYQPVA